MRAAVSVCLEANAHDLALGRVAERACLLRRQHACEGVQLAQHIVGDVQYRAWSGGCECFIQRCLCK